MGLVILGAGGHGRVVAECAQAVGLSLLGFIDDNQALIGNSCLNLPVLGSTAAMEDGIITCEGLLLGIGHNIFRLQLARRFDNTKYSLPTLIHPRAWVSPSAKCDAGTVVMANATVQTGCRLGTAVLVNTNASVDHDSIVADGVHISPGARLAGGVTVGECTHIGIGATVIQGIHVGAHCLIAAGAVVIRDVADGTHVAGVPAHPMPAKRSP